jgi:ABC-type Na+ efflux pump permease subunit
MSKKKHPKKQQPASVPKTPQTAKSAVAPSPYLPVAHPPEKNPTLLVVSVILFVVWFLFLLMAAISSSSR